MTDLARTLMTLLLMAQGLEIIGYFWSTSRIQTREDHLATLPVTLLLQALRLAGVLALYSKSHHTAASFVATVTLALIMLGTTVGMWKLAHRQYATYRSLRSAWNWTLIGIVQGALIVLVAVG